MTKIYGGRKRNGVRPAHFSVGSKNVARKVLQSLELLKMVEKDPNGWVPFTVPTWYAIIEMGLKWLERFNILSLEWLVMLYII